MMAFRVALACGIPDPITWLGTVSPTVIDYWWAYYRIEPWGDEWRHTGRICKGLDDLLAFYAMAKGVKHPQRAETDFMPIAKVATPQPKQSQVPAHERDGLAPIGSWVAKGPKFAEIQAARQKAKVRL